LIQVIYFSTRVRDDTGCETRNGMCSACFAQESRSRVEISENASHVDPSERVRGHGRLRVKPRMSDRGLFF
jgi:hypothetical protein